jgi:hypothetical protein
LLALQEEYEEMEKEHMEELARLEAAFAARQARML